jgi:hypothetical protein
MDIPDAVLLNRAYSQLGDRTRNIIKVLWFRTHWRPQWQAQKIGCHFKELGEMGEWAKKMLSNRLTFIERCSTARVIEVHSEHVRETV